MDWDSIKKVIIIGLSNNPERDSNKVAKYFIERGYEIIPVNPNCDEVFGLKCYPSLADIPLNILEKVDMVDIFRKSEFVYPIVEHIVKNKNRFKNLKVIWMQEGVEDLKSYNLAVENGYEVIMNACAMMLHSR